MARSHDHVNIEIHQVIDGPGDEFIAWPVEGVNMASINKDLRVSGNTEEEVLAILIEKIKNLRQREIFPQEPKSKDSIW